MKDEGWRMTGVRDEGWRMKDFDGVTKGLGAVRHFVGLNCFEKR